MSPGRSSSIQTQSLAAHRVRLLRIGLLAALVCLAMYAIFVAWDQFRTRPPQATSITPRGSGVRPVAAPAGQQAFDAAISKTLPAGERLATSEPAAGDSTGLREAPDWIFSGPDPAPPVESIMPDVDSQAVPILAAMIARWWEQSNHAVQEGIERTAKHFEQLAAAAQRQELAAEQQQEIAHTSEPTPSAVTGDPPEVKTVRSTQVKLVNPAETGGVIYYLVDGAAYSLYPGQMYQFDGEAAPRVEFHRGASFGDAMHDLGPGTYVFEVTANGWVLVEQPASSDGH